MVKRDDPRKHRPSDKTSHITPDTMQRQGTKSVAEYFARSLTAFQSSGRSFESISTLRYNGNSQERRTEKRLVVLDSSFNPPTKAHAQMARSAIDAAAEPSRTRLVLLLAVNNADKAPKPASFPIRLGMMEAFAHDLISELRLHSESNKAPDSYDGLEIDLAVTTLPYFHDKSRAIAESGIYPSNTEQVFLAGFDTLIRIFNPKYYGQGRPGGMKAALGPLFERARLRITTRPDDEWGTLQEQMNYLEELKQGRLEEVGGEREWADKVDMVEGVGGAVSSSKVRDLVKGGQLDILGDLVGEGVREWIVEEGLYRDEA
ncbi:hypothetical protein B0I35DRAFT_427863 [Stachybotrys elegans]|uniref:Nicotinamide-nucleotide adenylyltransferase n=1 Tax=Stachybotrys elegans TaxID=80388 RepID=A0A8K0STV6_9HYPO|nr:hypothetical protein B0I35DRAFT_427863 [Stachybotrys elegans]